MAKLVAIYKKPKDIAAFNRHYFATHVPLAKAIAGLRHYEASNGAVGLPVEPGAIHLVAILEFDSLDAINQALASPEG